MLRISGPAAGAALAVLSGPLPPARLATLRSLRSPQDGSPLDTALILWFPGPSTATGEDVAEIHAHGGRSTVRAIEGALATVPGLRRAEPGEFTRRALLNGRLDLAQVEGLGDLLAAETDQQRRAALALSEGTLSRAVHVWQRQLLLVSAEVEAMLDFADDDDVADNGAAIDEIIARKQHLVEEWQAWLARPSSQRLRDGVRVAIAGPPNVGKSTLLNALAEREAAIVSPVAGTTRDIVEVPLALDGIPFRFADTAGLREEAGDAIEAIGMQRARDWICGCDILLWLGDRADMPVHTHSLHVLSKADLRNAGVASGAAFQISLSAKTGQGMRALHEWLVGAARTLIPAVGEAALNDRHRDVLGRAVEALAACETDPLLIAEQLRAGRVVVDSITGNAGTDAMLDALFGQFCIGK